MSADSRPGWVTWTGLAVVAAAAAVLTFATVRDLAVAAGYPPYLAWLVPVVIDTTAVVGSRIWLGRRGQPGAVAYARALALTAAAVTIAANVLDHGLVANHLAPPWWLVATLAAIPPAALVAVAHQVALLTRPPQLPPARSEAPTAGPVESQSVDTSLADPLVEQARDLVTAGQQRGEHIGRGRLARELSIPENQARELLRQVCTNGSHR